MRKILSGIFLTMVILTISMPPAFASEPSPSIQFETMEYDFGKVLEGKALSHTFNFTNRGEGMLEIKGIKPG